MTKWFAIFALIVLLGGVTTFAVVMSYIKPLREQAATFDLSALHEIEKASQILDRRGAEIGRLYMLNRTPITIDQVPMHLIQALTAQEDERFFEHGGVDFVGIVRAVWLNYKAGSETQGASTITQQLAREAFKLKDLETGEKSSRYNRKIVEWFLAERIEQKYTKSEILELYLNRIYFGGGFYGIQAAATGYFGKNASELNVSESATICGIIKSPNNLQPLRFPERAANARNHVLNRMVEEGYLTKDERDTLSAKPVITADREDVIQENYVYEAVRQEAMRTIGSEAALLGGFQIHTTIDGKLQQIAEASVMKQLAEVEKHQGYSHQTYDQYHQLLKKRQEQMKAGKLGKDAALPRPEYLQAAVLAIDNNDGGILAMVGGRDFGDSEFNRALQSRRPAGTAFTPFVFATAFQSPNYFPPMQIDDRPIDNRRVMIGGLTGILGEWGSEQDVTTYRGKVTAREALAQGRNAATAELGERLGRGPVIELAKKMGIESPIRDYPSSFLGSSEVKLNELCLAYSAFPGKGKRPKQLNLISKITDDKGKIIYQIKTEDRGHVQVLDEMAAYQTHTCLVDALAEGTGKAAYSEYGLDKFPAAGKTGTHYEFKDLWFMGYTSSITCGVWTGFDQQKTIYEGAFSNRITLPIWVDIMNGAEKNFPAQAIAAPEDAEFVEVCKTSGMRATDGCYVNVTDASGATKAVRNTRTEALRHDTTFDLFCPEHPNTGVDIIAPRLRSPMAIQAPAYNGGDYVNVSPVRMQSMTLVGIDPYNTVLPVPKAEPVNPDGSRVIRAEPVEEPGMTESPIKLAPPPPLELE